MDNSYQEPLLVFELLNWVYGELSLLQFSNWLVENIWEKQ